MTVIRKREGDKGGCCNPYSELQLEIERVDQTAIDAKTTANNAEAMVNANMDKINEAIAIVPQVQTNTENIAQHESRINANTTDINKNKIDIQEQGKDIAALKTKTNDNAAAIEGLKNEIGQNKIDIQEQGKDITALNTKIDDNAAAIEVLENEIGPETVAGTIQYRLKDIDTKLPTAIKEVEMIADASTVTHKATHISGTAESDALPVVSREQAGIISASVYAAMEDVIANNTSRISVLEQSALTYDISGLVSADPTNAEISAAFHQKYPNIPIQPGIRVADYNNAHFWQYGNNMWILLTQIEIHPATNESLGVVKGSTADGKIFVETDGSMSLKGYDALVSKDATHDSKINTLEVGLGNANARIDATNTNVANNAADIVAANGNISTNTNDINDLKGRMATAEGQIATHGTKINQNTQSINGLSNNISGLNDRMSTAEGQIATHETKIDQHTQSINRLSTDVNGLNTNKQDKLTAGEGIAINNDVISVIPDEGMTLYQGSLFDLVQILTGEFKVLKRFGIEYLRYASDQYQAISYVEVQPFRIKRSSPSAYKTNFAAISTAQGANYLSFDSSGSSLTLYSGTFTYTGFSADHGQFDARQIKTESIDHITSSGNGAYFRIWT